MTGWSESRRLVLLSYHPVHLVNPVEASSRIGAAVADVYGWKLDASRERDAIALPVAAMRAVAGTYYIDPKDEQTAITISLEEGVMWIEAPFVKHSRLYAASEKQFFANTGHQFDIELDAEGRLSAILIQNGPRAVRR